MLSALEVAAAGGDEDVPAVRPLLDLAYALRRSEPGRHDARVLLVVDQLEEALGHDAPNHPANRFLALIRGSLQAPDSPLSVLCTMRSDFLGLFQSCPPLRGVNFDSLPLGPMRPGAMRCVIEEPARLAGIELEAGLVDRLLEDTETADALPLLSVTLWKLSADASHNGRLEIGGYERFGGIQGALAGEAEAILRAAQREGKQDALRRALLRMVRIRDDGQYARRPIRWDDGEIGAVRPLLEHFVERRLLVSRTDGDVPVVEVAHEALFRSWGPLRAWLDERRTDLLLEAQIRRDATAWAETGWPVDVLWRGGRLQQAEALVGQGRLSADERAFVGAGVRLRQRRRRSIASGALVLFALLSGAAVYSLHMAGNARTAARVAIAGNLVSQSREYLGTNHALALLLNAQALHFAPTADVQAGLLGSLEAEPYLLRVSEHADREGVPDQSPYCNERTDDALRASVEGSSDLWSEDRWVACEGIDEEKNHYARVVCRQGASAGPGECRSWETYIFSRRRWNEVPREDAASACRELEVVAGAETRGAAAAEGVLRQRGVSRPGARRRCRV